MDKTIDMAREAGMTGLEDGGLFDNFLVFEALVRADERNRLAKECALLPFGDTAASFAVWIRNGGRP